MTSKERCMAVLQRKKPDRVPVFPLMMFFAADRAKISYRRFSTDASALADAQLNLYENYLVDAVTACSDSYRISGDMGAQIQYPQNSSPYLSQSLVTCEAEFDALKRPDPCKPNSRMRERIDSVEQLAKAIGNKALVLGWIEMPFAEVCEWVGVQNMMYMLYDDPEFVHRMLNAATEIEIDYALAQLDAGAHMIGCGDSAASLVSVSRFCEFVLPYQQRVTFAIHKAGGLSKLHICGNSSHVLDQLAQNGADLYNVDHMVELSMARDIYSGMGKAFKGNVNPVGDLMSATAEQAQQRALSCITLCQDTAFMLSAGCEIPAATPDEVYFAFAKAPQMAVRKQQSVE